MEICKASYSLLFSLLFLFHSEAACRSLGRRPCKMQSFRIWDINQKTFYLRNNQLFAGHLQMPNTKLEVKLDMVPVNAHNVFLGIHNGKLCLSCVKSGDDIRLQLEAVNITDLSKNKEQNKRFTFIRLDNGSTMSFQSAACPGWFLCTVEEADQPVRLTNNLQDSHTVTQFYFREDQ
ncbi:interleukin-1 receptor antagonist protein isoform X1 [Cavia porcellus]|uniref:Interleukin-1 n=1 Tax=Cavia porcellus TaxID=10141 RepID=A0A286Y1I4_CAVPO|nr:interleukin-1 receptor antagonist protein isoform X2 [Cavia porcellus]